MKGIYNSILFFLFAANVLQAQQIKPPFWDDIQKFKKQDSINMPAKNKILFVGSSTFTKWTDVQSYFPSYPILNRGFGGSSLTDVIRYSDEVIFNYQPKQIIIYCATMILPPMILLRLIRLSAVLNNCLPLFATIIKKILLLISP